MMETARKPRLRIDVSASPAPSPGGTPKSGSPMLFSRKHSMHVPKSVPVSSDTDPADDASHALASLVAQTDKHGTPKGRPRVTSFGKPTSPKAGSVPGSPGILTKLINCFARSDLNPAGSPKAGSSAPYHPGSPKGGGRRSLRAGGGSPGRLGRRTSLEAAAASSPALLGPQPADLAGRKLLVLDLDETLVHSSFRPTKNPDYVIPVEIEGITHRVYVSKRPQVDEFMRRMGELYEICVYTASLSKYANPLLDLLDKHKVIRWRLFREHCTYYQGNYVKDMSRMGRPIEDVIIVDNSPVSFMFQPENAIPCGSYIDDPADMELRDMVPYLEMLNEVEDVREHLREDWLDIYAGEAWNDAVAV